MNEPPRIIWVRCRTPAGYVDEERFVRLMLDGEFFEWEKMAQELEEDDDIPY